MRNLTKSWYSRSENRRGQRDIPLGFREGEHLITRFQRGLAADLHFLKTAKAPRSQSPRGFVQSLPGTTLLSWMVKDIRMCNEESALTRNLEQQCSPLPNEYSTRNRRIHRESTVCDRSWSQRYLRRGSRLLLCQTLLNRCILGPGLCNFDRDFILAATYVSKSHREPSQKRIDRNAL